MDSDKKVLLDKIKLLEELLRSKDQIIELQKKAIDGQTWLPVPAYPMNPYPSSPFPLGPYKITCGTGVSTKISVS